MKQLYTYILSSIFLLSCTSAMGQIQIQNGSLEGWSGADVQHPDYWSSMDLMMGLKANRWTFRETMPDQLHSGLNAIKLYSDTISLKSGLPREYADSSSPLQLWPGILVYGPARYVNHHILTAGVPIYGRPISLSMYVKIYHPVTDTMRMRMLLTRWNANTHLQDTLAYEHCDIFADSSVMNAYAYFIDTINYRMEGQADTARIIITGGRRGNPQLQGNTVWIDDLKFNYPNDQVVHSRIDEEVVLYPNPASDKIKILTHTSLTGYTIIFLDREGIKTKEVLLDEGTANIDVTDMPDGVYSYTIVDSDQNKLHEGSINIMKSR